MKVIGVIVPGITNMFFAQVLEGIESYTKKVGYDVFIVNGIKNEKMEMQAINTLMSGFADGIIVADPKTQNVKSGFLKEVSEKIPLVLINGYNENIDLNYVISDEVHGSNIAMDYISSLGHKQIAFIRGKDSYSYDIKEEVYMKYSQINKFSPLIIQIEDGNTIDVVKNTEKIIEEKYKDEFLNKKFTACFACNDLMAYGAINAFRRIGLKVPRDISVMGFDNILLSEMSNPSITTVDQHMNELGIAGAERIVNLIEGSKSNKKIIIDTELIKRESF